MNTFENHPDPSAELKRVQFILESCPSLQVLYAEMAKWKEEREARLKKILQSDDDVNDVERISADLRQWNRPWFGVHQDSEVDPPVVERKIIRGFAPL
jgi:hypothetical protein